MGYIAHIRENDGEIQPVFEHLESVQALSEKYGSKIGVKYLAGLSGLLHDLGKNTDEFKEYIQEAVANPENAPRKGSVDHSTAGGKLLYQRFYNESHNAFDKLAVEWMAMSIISHHSGLRDYLGPDMSSHFLYRVAEKELEEYDKAVFSFFKTQISEEKFNIYFGKAKEEVKHILKTIKENNLQSIVASLIIKYIFSCLIDADRTDSRMFEENEKSEQEFNPEKFFIDSYDALMKKIKSYSTADNANHPINRLRSDMSRQCEEFAARPSGIYTLSIPTGGGKTLASLRYALKHAIRYKKDRIIFIVPYTTIIEQNAEEVRKILKNDEYILEHHSNVIESEDSDDEQYLMRNKKLKLAKDNWDSPIIFTTMVQFLNVFYSKGTRNVRRLHNLANSILIFDEVQSVPIKCVSLFNEALNFLKTFGNSSIVLCTATQPALDFVENKLEISTSAEMIKDMKQVSESFKRVNILDKTSPQGLNAAELKEFILTEMEKVNNLLVILNTKTAVRKLFEQLNKQEVRERHDYELFHLSTSMCPAHRKAILAEVKQELSDGKRVICVSTQLIEAGVDISFECVIRSLAGLDSIAQAAGRCNRHGEYGIRNVYVVKSSDEELSKLKEIRIGGEQTERILNEFQDKPGFFGNDLLSPEALNLYFKYYFDRMQNELNYPIKDLQKNLFELIDKNQDYYAAFYHKYGKKFPIISRQSFATAEQYFQVIDNPTTSILVPYNEEAKEIISELNGDLEITKLSNLLRKAQQYVVNVYSHEFETLDKAGNIDLLLHGNIYALKEVAYTKEMGLDFDGKGSWSMAMF